ncbi:MAG: CapA family protein [Myxococcota bacterium]
MSKLYGLAAALCACANAGGTSEPLRRPLASAEMRSAEPKPSQPVQLAASNVAASVIPVNPAPEPLVIVAGGDVNFGREVGQYLQHQPDYAPFAGIEAVWRNADVRFVNLESQLSFQHGETQSPLHRLIFTGPPEGAAALARANVTLVSTANNHAWDYGRGALFETLDNLAAAGVLSAGTGRDAASALRPVSLELKGTRIAWFAVTHVWNQGPIELHPGREHVAWANLDRIKSALIAARAEHDLVMLSYHGGAEYQDAPADPTRRFVDAVIDAGVDVVIGHHPHVIQGIGFRRERPIFYSLGNLVFGPRPEHAWTRYGMLAKIRVANGVRSYSICPYRIAGFAPVALEATREDKLRSHFLSHVKNASTAVGGIRLGDIDAVGCVEVLPAKLTHSPGDPPRVDPAARPLARR